jgi:hypothetical protein
VTNSSRPAHDVPDLVANKLVQVFAKWIDAPRKAWLYMFAIAAMTGKDWAAGVEMVRALPRQGRFVDAAD